MLRVLSFASVALVLGCAGDAGFDGGTNDAGTSSDSGPVCGTIISFDPFQPYADPVAPIRAGVNVVGAPGVFQYSWSLTFNNATHPFTNEASDGSQIGFIAAQSGVYRATVSISGPVPDGCSYADQIVNVLDPQANLDNYRLRTVPPSGVAPPQETIIQVAGGGDFSRAIALDPGLAVSGSVKNGASGPGVPAYVKLLPISAPYAFTELFTNSTGGLSTKLLGQNHDVLVIPTATTLAPKLVSWTATTPNPVSFVVGPGTVVTGTVLGPNGQGFSGAKIQLMTGVLPSTVGTTQPDGSFSLRADFPASSMITVKVTPPPASGLPRLEASAQFNLAQPLQITYASSLQTCSLANTPVRRATQPQANAKVTVVGTLAATAGTVTTGSVAANALGTVRVAASADGSGQLGSVLVPRAPLTAVVQLGANDFAIDPIDTSTCSAQTIDAAAVVNATGTAKSGNTTLPGVRIEATPLGVLAQADAQVVTVTTTNTGTFTLPLAAGGRYDVRFIDPFARAARLELSNVTSAGVPAMPLLPAAIELSGKVTVSGTTQPLPGTSVQILCATCTGVDAARPVAETATDSLSNYRLAIPDPGTM